MSQELRLGCVIGLGRASYYCSCLIVGKLHWPGVETCADNSSQADGGRLKRFQLSKDSIDQITIHTNCFQTALFLEAFSSISSTQLPNAKLYPPSKDPSQQLCLPPLLHHHLSRPHMTRIRATLISPIIQLSKLPQPLQLLLLSLWSNNCRLLFAFRLRDLSKQFLRLLPCLRSLRLSLFGRGGLHEGLLGVGCGGGVGGLGVCRLAGLVLRTHLELVGVEVGSWDLERHCGGRCVICFNLCVGSQLE